MKLQVPPSGRLLKAPENFIGGDGVRAVFRDAQAGRRDFVRGAFAAALATTATPAARAQAQPAPAEGGDRHILTLPAHTRGLGQPVVTDGYGKPSQHEANVQRRQSPGLTQTTQASVSFAPLQSLFGIVTPSGLHFERHHQGWWDIDPSQHRLMLNGSDEKMLRKPMVFSVDEIMRRPSVSRFHFIECGANTGMEWGNVAVPTCQYTHGMISCCEFTGVPPQQPRQPGRSAAHGGPAARRRHRPCGSAPCGCRRWLGTGAGGPTHLHCLPWPGEQDRRPRLQGNRQQIRGPRRCRGLPGRQDQGGRAGCLGPYTHAGTKPVRQ